MLEDRDDLAGDCWMSGHLAQRTKADSGAEMVTSSKTGGTQNSQQLDSCAAGAVSGNYPAVPHCTTPHYPAHFSKGSIIQLASGDLKRIEDLSTEDFVRSASISKDLRIDTSVVRGITPVADRGTIMLEFSVGQSHVQVQVESTMEHPFFVYNRGWSSYSPERTLLRYHLVCHQLLVNDRCISLTQKSSPPETGSFTNGSLASVKDSLSLVKPELKGWQSRDDVLPAQSAPSFSRTRLTSDSAVLSQQFHHRK